MSESKATLQATIRRQGRVVREVITVLAVLDSANHDSTWGVEELHRLLEPLRKALNNE